MVTERDGRSSFEFRLSSIFECYSVSLKVRWAFNGKFLPRMVKAKQDGFHGTPTHIIQMDDINTHILLP